MMSRGGHTPEMEMSRTPQTPNSESHSTHTQTQEGSPTDHTPYLAYYYLNNILM